MTSGVKPVHLIGALSSWEMTRLKEMIPTWMEEYAADYEFSN